MTARETIERLASSGARLSLEGEELFVEMPEDMPASMIEVLRGKKPEIIAYLRQEINWRVVTMRGQLANRKGVFLPLLTAQQGITDRKNYCFSCGEKLNQFDGYFVCDFCIKAKYLALGLDRFP